MTKSLYDVLGLTASATQSDIKKARSEKTGRSPGTDLNQAYYRLALQLHPDKNPGDESAAEKFQALQRVYAVLGDAEKRKVYDETGVEDSVSGEQFDGLYKYYRDVYAKVTPEDVCKYETTYRGSAAERHDLLELYTRFEGDTKLVFEWLCCSRPEVDSHRFADALRQAVDAGEVSHSKKFDAWAKRVARKPAPADPLAVADSDMHGSTDLVAAIRGRAPQEGGSFLDKLAAKYGGDRGGKRPSAGAVHRQGHQGAGEAPQRASRRKR